MGDGDLHIAPSSIETPLTDLAHTRLRGIHGYGLFMLDKETLRMLNDAVKQLEAEADELPTKPWCKYCRHWTYTELLFGICHHPDADPALPETGDEDTCNKWEYHNREATSA